MVQNTYDSHKEQSRKYLASMKLPLKKWYYRLPYHESNNICDDTKKTIWKEVLS